MDAIGTPEYGKWLDDLRKHCVHCGSGGGGAGMEEWYECYMPRVRRTPEEQDKAKRKYIKLSVKWSYDSLASQVIKHKVVYYKLLEESKRWKAFDELCDLNADTKEEIRKYLAAQF